LGSPSDARTPPASAACLPADQMEFADQRIYSASKRGDTKLVRQLLMSRAPAGFTSVTEGGNTPLFVASQSGHIEIVSLLIDFGAKKNVYCQVRSVYHQVFVQFHSIRILLGWISWVRRQVTLRRGTDQGDARDASETRFANAASYLWWSDILLMLEFLCGVCANSEPLFEVIVDRSRLGDARALRLRLLSRATLEDLQATITGTIALGADQQHLEFGDQVLTTPSASLVSLGISDFSVIWLDNRGACAYRWSGRCGGC